MEGRRVRIRRIGQLVDDVDELCDAARPSMCEDQWNRVRARGTTVQKVNSKTVDGGSELADLIQAGLE